MNSLTDQVGVQSDSFSENFFLEAKKLNDAKWIYGLYGAMDGLSTSFSMLKYFFDMYYTSSRSASSDVLHDWSLTPLGVAFITLEAAALIGCSVVGNTVDDDGYYLHLMSVDEAKKFNHTNCFIWDTKQLVYLDPDGTETVFNREGDSVNVGLITKITSKANKVTRSLHLSTKQANGLVVANGRSFIKAPPTPSFTGTIASYWPYARDVMKAMKNTYKGIRNTFVLTDLLVVGREYHYLAVPVGLTLGVLAAYNRTWLRTIRDERKDAKKTNIELLDSLIKTMSEKKVILSLSDWDDFHKVIAKEHDDIRVNIQPPSHSQLFWLYAQLSGAFSGLIDSPYLYFGALSLTVAAPSSLFFIFVATASFIFAATCIATRVYEEQIFQRELLASQLEVELAMSIREIQLLCDNLSAINAALRSDIDIGAQDLNELDIQRIMLTRALNKKWGECKVIQKDFFYHSNFSLGYIIMSGLKNGLDTYGAMASLMFLIATINLVIMVPFSQFLVLGFVTAGLAGLVIFPALALMRHFYPPIDIASCPEKKKSTLHLFSDLVQKMEETNNASVSLSTPVVYDGLLEIVRGSCSGAGKGIRGAEQVLAVSQELGSDGHYHDTDSMLIFAVMDAILFALTFGLRGFARLGRGVAVVEKSKKDENSDKALAVAETEVIIETSNIVGAKVNDTALTIIAPSTSTVCIRPNDILPSPVTVVNISKMSQENMSYLAQNSLFKPSSTSTPSPPQIVDADIVPGSTMGHYTF